jgi:hypothetical protein
MTTKSLNDKHSFNEQPLDSSGAKALSKLPNYLYLSLAVLWLYSGIVPVIFSPDESLALLSQLGINDSLQKATFLIASVIDIMFGLLILSRYRYHPWLWFSQLIIVIGYSIIVGVGLPENWVHPFAPLIKNVPIIALLLYLFQQHLFD